MYRSCVQTNKQKKETKENGGMIQKLWRSDLLLTHSVKGAWLLYSSARWRGEICGRRLINLKNTNGVSLHLDWTLWAMFIRRLEELIVAIFVRRSLLSTGDVELACERLNLT